MIRPDVRQFRQVTPRARGGFTLIEVLVVVLILGIASAIILPQISSQDDLDAASAARAVMADLLYAQNRAIATQQYHFVVFNVSGQSYSLYSGTSSSGPSTLLTHPINLGNYIMTFGQGGPNNISGKVTLGSANFNGASAIAFNELGVPYSYNEGSLSSLTQPGTIVLNCGSYSMTISVAQDTGDLSVN